MLIYGALLAICGGGVSCQMQWKTFAVQQNGLNYGAISVLSRVDMTQEGISDSVIKWTDKNPDRRGACLRTHICCIKIKHIAKLIVLSWKEKLDKLMTWGTPVTSIDYANGPHLSVKSTCGTQGPICLHAPDASSLLLHLFRWPLGSITSSQPLPHSLFSRGNIIFSWREQISFEHLMTFFDLIENVTNLTFVSCVMFIPYYSCLCLVVLIFIRILKLPDVLHGELWTRKSFLNQRVCRVL